MYIINLNLGLGCIHIYAFRRYMSHSDLSLRDITYHSELGVGINKAQT